MKSFSQIISLLLIITLFTFSECNKGDIVLPLPDETQTGANTFGCKIDGNIYRAKGFGNCFTYLVQYYKNDSTLLIKTNQGCGTALHVYLTKVFDQTNYQIFLPSYNSFLYSNSNATCSWFDKTNSVQSGTITITEFDLPNKIVSGRFSGVIKQTGCPDVILTEGRFDFKMDVYN